MKYSSPLDPAVAKAFVGRVVYSANGGQFEAHTVVALQQPQNTRFNKKRYLVTESGKISGDIFDDESEALEAALLRTQSDIRFARFELADIQERLESSLQTEAELLKRIERVKANAGV